MKSVFLGWWWVVFFVLLCFAFLEQGMKQQDQEHAKLSQRLEELKNEKEKAFVIQGEWLLQRNSESDPAWIELVLMQHLGLVPEGQIKVFFD